MSRGDTGSYYQKNEVKSMGSKKLSGSTKGYLILLGLVVLSWGIFKVLSPHNFGSAANMLNYFQAVSYTHLTLPTTPYV